MPIIDMFKSRYVIVPKPTKDNPDNYTWELEALFKGLSIKNSFYANTYIAKARGQFECRCCQKKRGAGTRYIGDNWCKICQFCLEEWFKNSQQTLKEMGSRLKEQKKLLSKNKDKWYKEAMVGALAITEE